MSKRVPFYIGGANLLRDKRIQYLIVVSLYGILTVGGNLYFLFNTARQRFSQDNTGRVIVQFVAYNTSYEWRLPGCLYDMYVGQLGLYLLHSLIILGHILNHGFLKSRLSLIMPRPLILHGLRPKHSLILLEALSLIEIFGGVTCPPASTWFILEPHRTKREMKFVERTPRGDFIKRMDKYG
ncbi:hypothetical protein JHK87_000815 [Glycine soja]|nr:hypothetical protein JHK87_000815 [Glycine soja]